jgi:hypothetical protein
VIYKYKDTIASLKKDGSIKECSIDIKVINNLIKRSLKDIETAKRNLEIDNDCSYNFAYNALLHAGLAFMESRGLRPNIIGKHVIIVKFLSAVLGKKFSDLINNYDYQGIQYCSQEYINILKESNIKTSMSERANPYDNAKMESFF